MVACAVRLLIKSRSVFVVGEDATNEQSYRYLTIDEMKSLGDDSLPIDTTREDRYDTTAGKFLFAGVRGSRSMENR